MRVLSLDPGEKVGWARADVDEDGAWTNLEHGIAGLKDMALKIHEVLVVPEPYADHYGPSDYDVVVVEDWRLYAQFARQAVGSNFPSVQFIGMVRLCCWLSDVRIEMYGASTKGSMLKVMERADPELYAKVTQSGTHDDLHDMDALIHLFRWTWRNTNRRPA
jgi:hypothetical protein